MLLRTTKLYIRVLVISGLLIFLCPSFFHMLHDRYISWQLNFPGGFTGHIPYEQCLANSFNNSTPRVTYATIITNDAYFEGIVGLHCSLRKHGAKAPLLVLYDAKKLSEKVIRQLQAQEATGNLTLRELGPGLRWKNTRAARWAETWNKLLLFSYDTDYDMILFLDADVIVRRNLDPLLNMMLPAPIACAPAGYRMTYSYPATGYCLSGMMLIRPCLAVYEHMTTLLNSQPKLRFESGWAEQDFLDHYFRYRRVILPYVIHAVHHHVNDAEMYKSGEVWVAHMAEKPWNPKRSPKLDWSEYDSCQAQYTDWFIQDKGEQEGEGEGEEEP